MNLPLKSLGGAGESPLLSPSNSLAKIMPIITASGANLT